MIDSLTTTAELKAAEAEKLPAFDGINLIGIKRKLETLLAMIGRDGIFDEYTVHDISHIDAMLRQLDWLVPKTTRDAMTPADWMLSVLSIYFHDVGLLVTKDEYSRRAQSGFREFCDTKLFADDVGVDYKARVDELVADRRDRFLYQEFVRFKHAERIREWILGKAPERLGCSHATMTEISALLDSLKPPFRRDLALVCESHHLDDLSDMRKYKPSQPYGNSDAETANIQYSAILLRAADLLHITADRTPSIAFRIINPSDPISQEEWSKQMAVTRLRPQVGKDKEGNISEKVPRDTIEVHAYFTKPDGFFGLTSYLTYAKSQLGKCNEWATSASEFMHSSYQFPWRYIDDAFIETEGFLRDSFEFTIDQARILDLLTGHTLYNETSVVLREIVQNSLDAVRLQRVIYDRDEKLGAPSAVRIEWDSSLRTLTIEDNGTGMTQSVIERHLLRVGSSRYQDAEFKKTYPEFSSISRFGIGVLSTFMVADSVEILTVHPDDDVARMLNLRSVHGKYLIQLLEKEDISVPRNIVPHGTRVRLRVRPSAKLPDVLQTACHWIVFPNCDVTLTIDGGAPIRIGFDTPRDALQWWLRDAGMIGVEGENRRGESGRPSIKVEEVTLGGVTVAFALRWSEYFREWSFVSGISHVQRKADGRLLRLPVGTCIEGIRVEGNCPGFQTLDGVIAIANAKGSGAPKTNVARSTLEQTEEYDRLLRSIYSAFCNHVRSELENMQSRPSVSLTWATQEGRYLLQPLLNHAAISVPLLYEVISELPLILAEGRDGRYAATIKDLQRLGHFWVIVGQFFRSAENLIREASSSASLGGVMKALGETD